jgi:hypothetical protein
MSQIEVIQDQTKFLLETYEKMLAFYKKEFESLYAEIEAEQEKAEKVSAGKELVSFQNVFSILSLYEKETVGQAQEDVEFLKEQLGVIDQIAQIEDKEKAQELTQMLLEEGDELPETAQFKVDAEQDCLEAQEGFSLMINDIKEALIEDGIIELERMLEAHREEIDQESGSDEECDKSSCSSCSGCNLFEGLELELDETKEK